jgi:methanogenic corrinoid protein MtbC1
MDPETLYKEFLKLEGDMVLLSVLYEDLLSKVEELNKRLEEKEMKPK